MDQVWKMSGCADSFVTMRGKLLKCSNWELSIKLYLSRKQQAMSVFHCAKHFRKQKHLAQFSRSAFQSAVDTRWMSLIPTFKKYALPSSQTLAKQNGVKASISQPPRCNRPGETAEKQDWFLFSAGRVKSDRKSWFPIKAACCCLASFYHNAAVVGTFSGRKNSGALLGTTELCPV